MSVGPASRGVAKAAGTGWVVSSSCLGSALLGDETVISRRCMICEGLRLAQDYRFLLLSVTMHSTSSRRQFVHGAPCSTTLQRTLRDLQH